MAPSRSTLAHSKQFVASLGFSSGNGRVAPESDSERLVRIELLLGRVQEALETQFERISDMQAIIDRLTAERGRSPAIVPDTP